ncbi:hypothetical protein MIMGU_mgv1a024446mg [Erythranthe guttata]|uniref:Rx N-terminal domain-containing protein n=1 Tax=Erythranthe guttata TaxID=4155 RepID=A0A022QIB6_ERYGU|nr:hypothetical protein MIMGU_mgv1a024446mg [Erythranthe guttata]
MADVAILIAVERLGELLIKKATLLQEECVEGQLRLLKGRLERMQSFQKDASDKESNNERIRNWISKIRDVAQDTEDAMMLSFEENEHYWERVGIRVGLFGYNPTRSGITRPGRVIFYVTGFFPGSGTRCSQTGSDKHVVDVDVDTNNLLKEFILNESARELSVATNVGMGGIGKSCLARHLYNHTQVADHFDYRLWVFVFILDDVWEDEHWETLASLFPCEEKACSLLLSSRNRVATMNAPYIHEMKLLDPEKSWELLLNKTSVKEFKGKLENLKKCRGMPSTIVMIGGLLIDRNPCTEKWEKNLKEINFHFGENELPELY